MKKTLSIALIAVLCICMLAGCGSSSKSSKSSKSKKKTSTSVSTTISKEDEDDKTSSSDSTDVVVSASEEETTPESPEPDEIYAKDGSITISWNTEYDPEILEIDINAEYNGDYYCFVYDTAGGTYFTNTSVTVNGEFVPTDSIETIITQYSNFGLADGRLTLWLKEDFIPVNVMAYCMNSYITYEEGIRSFCNFQVEASIPCINYEFSTDGHYPNFYTQYPTGVWEYSVDLR